MRVRAGKLYWVAVVVAIGAMALLVPVRGGAGAAEAQDEPSPRNAPSVAQFDYPREFFCLPDHPGQAQVIVGWSVPGAKRVAVFLDGDRLRSGIRDQLPFWVPAGDASGIGATVVFPCAEAESRRIKVRWRIPSKPAIERKLTIRKAQER